MIDPTAQAFGDHIRRLRKESGWHPPRELKPVGYATVSPPAYDPSREPKKVPVFFA